MKSLIIYLSLYNKKCFKFLSIIALLWYKVTNEYFFNYLDIFHEKINLKSLIYFLSVTLVYSLCYIGKDYIRINVRWGNKSSQAIITRNYYKN